MVVKIELNFSESGHVVFVNFWNWFNGKDVIGELKKGKLTIDGKEITFDEFAKMVKERADEWPKE